MTTQDRIINLLKVGIVGQAELARRLGIKRPSVCKALQRMEKKGLVEGIGKTTNRYYRLRTDSGQIQDNVLSTMSSVPSYRKGAPVPSPSPQPKQRLHRLERKWEISARQLSLEGQEGLTEHQMQNNTQQLFEIGGIKGRITTKSVLVEGIQLIGELEVPSAELLRKAEEKADAVAREAARRFMLTIRNPSTSIYEIEITPFEPSKPVEEKGIITLYQKGRNKVWIDKSLNLDAIESNHVPYVERLREFAVDIEEYNGWNETKENVRAVSQLLLELGRRVQELEKRRMV